MDSKIAMVLSPLLVPEPWEAILVAVEKRGYREEKTAVTVMAAVATTTTLVQLPFLTFPPHGLTPALYVQQYSILPSQLRYIRLA